MSYASERSARYCASAVDRIAAYVVTGTLGKGGFGEVVAAHHDVLGRDVAIKILHGKWSDDGEAVRRFVSEARTVNAVRHPNIVDVFDFGRLDDGRHYHVMERLRGESLHARITARGRLVLAEAIPILRAMASALDAAHAAGVVHRDVKPENVFLHVDGDREVAKLIDFGLAKLITPESEGPTQSGVILGTPAYMAPEQCRGAAIDHRTDVYAFGVVAYEMLTGTQPHRGDDPVATLLAHVHDETEPPSRRAQLARGVDAIVLPLLAKKPSERPGKLLPIVDALAALVDGSAPMIRRAPRRTWLVALAIAAVGAGGLALALAMRAPAAERANLAIDAALAREPDAAIVTAPADARPSQPDAAIPTVVVPDAGRTRPNPEEPENPYGP